MFNICCTVGRNMHFSCLYTRNSFIFAGKPVQGWQIFSSYDLLFQYKINVCEAIERKKKKKICYAAGCLHLNAHVKFCCSGKWFQKTSSDLTKHRLILNFGEIDVEFWGNQGHLPPQKKFLATPLILKRSCFGLWQRRPEDVLNTTYKDVLGSFWHL